MEDLLTIMSLIVAGISGIAGIVWSTYYKDAKQAQLDAKDDLIEGLKELSPPKVREAFTSMKEQLEDYIDQLKNDIKKLETTIKELETKHSNVNSELEESKKIINNLNEEISKIEIKESDKEPARIWIRDINKSIINSQNHQIESKQLQIKLKNDISEIERDLFSSPSSLENGFWKSQSSIFVNPNSAKIIDPPVADGFGSILVSDTDKSDNDVSNGPDDEAPASVEES